MATLYEPAHASQPFLLEDFTAHLENIPQGVNRFEADLGYQGYTKKVTPLEKAEVETFKTVKAELESMEKDADFSGRQASHLQFYRYLMQFAALGRRFSTTTAPEGSEFPPPNHVSFTQSLLNHSLHCIDHCFDTFKAMAAPPVDANKEELVTCATITLDTLLLYNFARTLVKKKYREHKPATQFPKDWTGLYPKVVNMLGELLVPNRPEREEPTHTTYFSEIFHPSLS